MKLFPALATFCVLMPAMVMANCPTAEQLHEVFLEAHKANKAHNCSADIIGFDPDKTVATDKYVFHLSGLYHIKNKHGQEIKGEMNLETKELRNDNLSLGSVIYTIQKSIADSDSSIVLEDSQETCVYKMTIPFGGDIGTKIFELHVRPKH